MKSAVMLAFVLMVSSAAPAAYEDWTDPAWVETDPYDNLTIQANHIEHRRYDECGAGRLVKDFGEDYWGDFTIQFEWESIGNWSNWSGVRVGFANESGYFDAVTGDAVWLEAWTDDTFYNPKIRIISEASGSETSEATGLSSSHETRYYTVLERSGTTLTVTIYTGGYGVTQVATASMTCVSTAFRYVHAVNKPVQAYGGPLWHLYNLDLDASPQEPLGTVYVGPSASGNGSGSDRDNLMAIATFKAGATPGDIALLQPGSYGALAIDDGYGDAEGYVTYRADPGTCTARASTWYEGTITEPSSEVAPVFSGVTFSAYESEGEPGGHYVKLEGLSVVDTGEPGYLLFLDQYVSHVTISDCSFWGVQPADPVYHRTDERSEGLYLYPVGNPTGPIEDILIERAYVERTSYGLWIYAGTENVLVKDCHIRDTCNSITRVHSPATLDGLHIEVQNAKADSVIASDVEIVSVGEPDTQVFTHAGSQAENVQFCRVVGGDDDELRKIASYVGTTITTDTPFSFSIDPEAHTVTLYHWSHGSGIAMFSGNLTIRNCRVHNGGGTGGIVLYQAGAPNLTIENNLVYDIHNEGATFDLEGTAKAGDNLTIRNNTIIGRQYGGGYIEANPQYHYGVAYRGDAYGETDTSTWTITNNIFVGMCSGPPSDAIAQGNIVYSDFGGWPGHPPVWYEEDEEGVNQKNLMYYAGESYPNEPTPFDEGFFMGGEGFEDAFTVQHGLNFNEHFRLAEESDGVGFANPTYAAATDITGAARDGDPDAGAYEYPSAKKLLILRVP